jgi:two-component system heavy metal sensor histidine kinase CusS
VNVPLSIRWRLTLWNTVALAVVLACFAALVYGLLRQALYQQTDRLLLASLDLLRADPRIDTDTGERLHHWVEEFKEHQGLLCVVYRPDGTIRARTPELAEESLPPPPADGGERLRYDEQLAGPTGGRHRVLAEQLRLGKEEYVVLLLAPLEAVDRELERTRAVLLAAGPAALLLSAGFGWWLARKALAPVDQLRRATEAVTAERLDRRLSVVNPGDELGRLTQTINAMIARLERSFAEIRRFTADACGPL